MKQYRIEISNEARSNLMSIYDHIAYMLASPETAKKQYLRLEAGILSLKEMPERIKLVDFEPERSGGLHRLLVDHYSVFFVIENDTVVVTNVLYSASDVERRMKNKEHKP